ncbi:MAG TPA: glycine oxidase ThiO [Planctomycetaceae bacterium]|nr:glycine oxidase ThiO [Planctomycetaceae bacterium]
MSDVLVIGGGVIGLSIAYELSQHNLSVIVLEQGQFGQEASWAGAGMLPPGNSAWAATPEARLRSASYDRWPSWVQSLHEATGISTGFVRCGGIMVARHDQDHEFSQDLSRWNAERLVVESLSPQELRQRFPFLGETMTRGCYLPDVAQVRNPWLIQSLYAACAQRGVTLLAGHAVTTFESDGHRIHSVRTPAGDFSAGQFVIAGGAWSGGMTRQLGIDLHVEPVRGQIVLLESRPLPCSHVIENGTRYIVPRPDGRILIGSTEEHVGFDKRTTAGGVTGLLALAQELVPCLAQARVERTWAGLRPYRPGGLPYLGRGPGYDNLFIAAGHYRAGLQLSPITAQLIRELVLGQPASLPLEN